MPIYAYRCESCGHAKDVLQKVSDAVLTTCPACNAESFKKQLTAAGFQLKGSGWYVTDFRGNGGAKPDAATAGSAAGTKTNGANGDGANSDSAKSDTAPAAASSSASSTSSSDSNSSGATGSSSASV